jgi:DNA-binding response OmpR family regulator
MSHVLVLIVEDEENFSWILKQGLNKEKFLVFIARDGEQGLKMAEEKNPDLILLDILMPKMDGITMAKKIKEKGIESKIIFLTNLKDLGYINQAIETIKEVDYIVKADLHVEQIVDRVKEKMGMK